MVVIVGLRNPEVEYDGTRHNIGAVALSEFAAHLGVQFKRARRGIRALVAEEGTGTGRVLLALPTTSMNHSGQAVAPLLRYHRVSPADLLLLHDDIDLPFGKLRLQSGRGSGGHNGVASVIASIGDPSFWRLKLGVGRPPGSMDPADFVLRRFAAREREGVQRMIAGAVEVLEVYRSEGAEPARQRAGEVGRS